eukprot:gene27779-34305_t
MAGVFGVALAFFYKWDLALVLLLTSPVGLCGAYLLTTVNVKSEGLMQTAYAKAGGVASETVGNIRTVAALQAEPESLHRYIGFLDSALVAGIQRSCRTGFANGCLFATGNIMIAVGFVYGAYRLARGLEDTEDADGYNCMDYPYCLYATPPCTKQTDCSYSGSDLLNAIFGLQNGAQGLGLVEPAISA